jgi:hypothetical protein
LRELSRVDPQGCTIREFQWVNSRNPRNDSTYWAKWTILGFLMEILEITQNGIEINGTSINPFISIHHEKNQEGPFGP